MDRRDFVKGFGSALATPYTLQVADAAKKTGGEEPPRQPVSPFEFDDVIRQARELAGVPFAASDSALPDALARLDYDTYRDIRFRPDKALLAENGSAFRLHMFHLGFLYKNPVHLNIVRQGQAVRVPYSAAFFDYGKNRFQPPLPPDLGYAGFRLHFPLNTPNVYDEVIAFLGASYFRFLGRSQVYGLSARALAIESGGPEEFPVFREFWIDYPPHDAQSITIYALLDSLSITGAYHFVVQPHTETVIDVSLTLFPRRTITRLGIAPLTSMFWVSQSEKRYRDFRPEVHDSDGLQILSATGEWIWRPLRNPPSLSISSFMDGDARGFGLIQRDRNYENYADFEALYERRPSYWIEPIGKWGEGHIELVEIPTPVEANDNIVCFWTPKSSVEAGHRLSFAYRMTALIDNFKLNPTGVAQNTFLTELPSEGTSRMRRYIVDFSRGDLAFYSGDPKAVEIVVTTSAGQATAELRPNPHINGFRAIIVMALDASQEADIKAFLKAGTQRLTETWTALWKMK
jgi:glucans biosynthesis protein